jgi:hypothetical protein
VLKYVKRVIPFPLRHDHVLEQPHASLPPLRQLIQDAPVAAALEKRQRGQCFGTMRQSELQEISHFHEFLLHASDRSWKAVQQREQHVRIHLENLQRCVRAHCGRPGHMGPKKTHPAHDGTSMQTPNSFDSGFTTGAPHLLLDHCSTFHQDEQNVFGVPHVAFDNDALPRRNMFLRGRLHKSPQDLGRSMG